MARSTRAIPQTLAGAWLSTMQGKERVILVLIVLLLCLPPGLFRRKAMPCVQNERSNNSHMHRNCASLILHRLSMRISSRPFNTCEIKPARWRDILIKAEHILWIVPILECDQALIARWRERSANDISVHSVRVCQIQQDIAGSTWL